MVRDLRFRVVDISTEHLAWHGSGPRRSQGVLLATLVVGTAILAATLAAPSGSALFLGLGFLAAMTWIVGGLLAGPIQWTRDGARALRVADLVLPIALGAALFGAIATAKLAADQVPFLAHGIHSVLARADSGSQVAVLTIALVNGVGEEILFRGALHDAFDRHPAVWAPVIYCVVTIATLNVALVAAAVVLGSAFALERRVSGGVLAPILTHLSWSTLVLLFLPR